VSEREKRLVALETVFNAEDQDLKTAEAICATLREMDRCDGIVDIGSPPDPDDYNVEKTRERVRRARLGSWGEPV
jgi:hypothetical protein